MNGARFSWRDMDEPSWLGAAEGFVLSALDVVGTKDWEVSILFCGDEFIRNLNRDYRGIDEATDVLSFGMGETVTEGDEKIYISGDLVISLPACERNAHEFGVEPDEELKRLILHGLLHLLGMDHVDNAADEPMLLRQEAILAAIAGERIL
ncbi:MAG: rRNA maturation RNase YbeY [Spirochaetes bacterium]|nr:rRNA maturation RNase YbeY [Spirochaetota bacterium]